MSVTIPKISVIMPSLNVADYIKECVDSVINQSLKDIEIIFVDAGSDDGTLEILKDYENKDSRIKLITSDKRSYGYQMNLGIAESNGEYIAIVETDDYISLEMFEKLYALSHNASIDIVKGNFYHYNEDTNTLKRNDGKKRFFKDKNPFTLEQNPYILHAHPSIWAGIYKTDFIKSNNIKFLEEKGGGWVDNPFFFETACLAKSIVYTDEPFYYYRESNPNSSSNNLEDFTIPIKRMIDNLNIIKKYNCKSEDIYVVTYWRVSAYISNISRREGYEKHLHEIRPLLKEMMELLDEDIVLRRLNLSEQLNYYRFISPLKIHSEFTSQDYNLIVKENDFIYSALDKLQKENRNLKKDLNKQNKINDELISSSSWKITKPIRSIKGKLKK